MSLLHAPPFRALLDAERVLIAGAGGGFDVFCGVPLGCALRRAGKEVTHANLTFTYLGGTDAGARAWARVRARARARARAQIER